MSIPILEMSMKARKLVLDSMNPATLFMLFLTSKRMRTIVRLQMACADTCHWEVRPYIDIPISIVLTFNGRPHVFRLDPNVYGPDFVLPVRATLDVCQLLDCNSTSSETYWLLTPTQRVPNATYVAFEEMSRRLIACFQPRQFTVRITTIDMTLDCSFLLNLTNVFHSVWVDSEAFLLSSNPQNMQFVLERMNAEHVEFYGVRDDVVYTGRITARHLTTRGSWLKLNNVLSSQCHSLTVADSHLSNDDYNTILSMWGRGAMRDLERFEATNAVTTDIRRILDGMSGDPLLAKIKNDPKIKSVTFKIGRSDGRIGEVTYNGSRLLFHVLN